MKFLKLFSAIILFACAANAQENLPTIKSNAEFVSIQNGAELRKDAWRLAPEAKSNVYEAELIDGKTTKVSFITDVNRISFDVEEGKKYDFIHPKR